MRYALFAILAVAGCGSAQEGPGGEPLDLGTDITFDPKDVDHPQISELDTDRLRPPAKTIEWSALSTSVGESFHSDAVVVDRIHREDADHNFGVRVLLKNTTRDVLKMEYLVRFVMRAGGELGGYTGSNGAGDRWSPFALEPYGIKEVGDFCRVMGADGFKLFVRGAGAATDGKPDDPAKKEERRQARQGIAPK